MAPQLVRWTFGQSVRQIEICRAPLLEAGEPIYAPLPQKPVWGTAEGGELDDSATELASTEGGSDDERSSEDVSPSVTPGPFPMEETLVIFDWDDTLLPTTWLRQHSYSLHSGPILNQEHRLLLQDIAASAAEVLHEARQRGKVVIVTNAETGWVQLSCQKFLPNLLPSLNGLEIVSARSTYESPAVRTPAEWKCLAFAHQVAAYFGHPTNGRFWNVVVLGDSIHEQQALSYSTHGVVTCHAKFVKFLERPIAEELVAEHKDVLCCFRRIVDHDGDLDLQTPGLELSPGAGELAASFEGGVC